MRLPMKEWARLGKSASMSKRIMAGANPLEGECKDACLDVKHVVGPKTSLREPSLPFVKVCR